MDAAKKLELLKELKMQKNLELEAIQSEIQRLEKEVLSKTKEKTEFHQDLDELLKEIKGYPRFFINRKGQVFHEAGMEMPISQKDYGNFVTLFDESNTKVEVSITKLVASSWLTDGDFSVEIKHLDGDIYNDHADNLKLK